MFMSFETTGEKEYRIAKHEDETLKYIHIPFTEVKINK